MFFLESSCLWLQGLLTCSFEADWVSRFLIKIYPKDAPVSAVPLKQVGASHTKFLPPATPPEAWVLFFASKSQDLVDLFPCGVTEECNSFAQFKKQKQEQNKIWAALEALFNPNIIYNRNTNQRSNKQSVQIHPLSSIPSPTDKFTFFAWMLQQSLSSLCISSLSFHPPPMHPLGWPFWNPNWPMSLCGLKFLSGFPWPFVPA